MKTKIHISQPRIRENLKRMQKSQELIPVITVKTYQSNTYAEKVEIIDDSGKVIAELRVSLDKPLSCGARVWIEADSKNIKKYVPSKKKN